LNNNVLLIKQAITIVTRNELPLLQLTMNTRQVAGFALLLRETKARLIQNVFLRGIYLDNLHKTQFTKKPKENIQYLY
jgi:hypothetical protein